VKIRNPQSEMEEGWFMSRLRELYKAEVVSALTKHFGYGNVMAVPKLVKININMGLGEAITNAKLLDVASDELGAITGQRPVVTKAKKSPSRPSSSGKGCPSASPLLCAVTGCTNSWIGW